MSFVVNMMKPAQATTIAKADLMSFADKVNSGCRIMFKTSWKSISWNGGQEIFMEDLGIEFRDR
jgi:hypothetical protein